MKYEDLSIKQIHEIKSLQSTCKTIGEWKRDMRSMAQKLEITDQDILKANRS